ncbi:MAG: hypothetical protein U9N44_05275 [Chloroflexota bacterium]|nr:hypothetical protein [Chloroflexota bacterium]
MKIKPLITGILIAILFITTTACSENVAVVKPSIGYVPDGWLLKEDIPYGEYTSNSGKVYYSNAAGDCGVMIYYGDIPGSLKGKENDEVALIDAAVEEAVLFEPEATGTMTVNGRIAGYAEGVFMGLPEIFIVFVDGSTHISIMAGYVTAQDETNAMALIDSIYFQ